MSEAAAKMQEARLIREKTEQRERERKRTCFKRLTAVFDIDEPRYRRSLNCSSANAERVRKGQEDWSRVERRASRNLQKSLTDRDKLAAGRCLPISVVQRHCMCCSARRGATRRVSANGKAASLGLPWRHDQSVDTSRERACISTETSASRRLVDRFTSLMSTRSYTKRLWKNVHTAEEVIIDAAVSKPVCVHENRH